METVLTNTELLQEIGSYFDTTDVKTCISVCKRWKQVFDSGDFWRLHFQRVYEFSSEDVWEPGQLAEGCETWKQIFRKYGQKPFCSKILKHEGRTGAILELANGRLATGGEDFKVRVWDTVSGAELYRIDNYRSAISMADSYQSILQLQNGSLAVRCNPAPRRTGGVKPDYIQIVDAKDGKKLKRLCDHEPAFPHHHEYNIWHLLELNDGGIASTASDTTVRLWCPKSGKELLVYKEHEGLVFKAIQLSGGQIASISDNSVRIWDRITGKTLKVLEASDMVTDLLQLSRGHLISASCNGTQVWDPDNGSKVLDLTTDDSNLTHCSDKILTIWEGLTTSLWDTNTYEKIHAFPVQAEWAVGARLAEQAQHGILGFFDRKTGSKLFSLKAHRARVSSLRVLKSGLLATSSQDATVRLWVLPRNR